MFYFLSEIKQNSIFFSLKSMLNIKVETHIYKYLHKFRFIEILKAHIYLF